MYMVHSLAAEILDSADVTVIVGNGVEWWEWEAASIYPKLAARLYLFWSAIYSKTRPHFFKLRSGSVSDFWVLGQSQDTISQK